MSTLRELARGERCMVRLSGVCSHDPAQTVLGHVRMIGISGIGHKAIDLLGSWVCMPCHMACDGQTNVPGLSHEQARLALLEGMARTIYELDRRGHIEVSETTMSRDELRERVAILTGLCMKIAAEKWDEKQVMDVLMNMP